MDNNKFVKTDKSKTPNIGQIRCNF